MTNKIDITVSRTISAPPEEVFDAWLNPEVAGTTWHDCEQLILHPEVDGLFYHAVEHRDRLWAHYGRFIALERGRTIQHTWMSEATRGFESIVTIKLSPPAMGPNSFSRTRACRTTKWGGHTRSDGTLSRRSSASISRNVTPSRSLHDRREHHVARKRLLLNFPAASVQVFANAKPVRPARSASRSRSYL